MLKMKEIHQQLGDTESLNEDNNKHLCEQKSAENKSVLLKCVIKSKNKTK